MTITSSGPGFVELELDLIPALRREIQASIPKFDMLPLVFKNASEVPDAQGLGSSFKCNTHSPQGIGCCDGQTKQAPQQRGTWRDFRRA